MNESKHHKKISGNAIREKNIAKFARKAGDVAIKKAKHRNAIIVVAKEGRVITRKADGTVVKGSAIPKEVPVRTKTIKLR